MEGHDLSKERLYSSCNCYNIYKYCGVGMSKSLDLKKRWLFGTSIVGCAQCAEPALFLLLSLLSDSEAENKQIAPYQKTIKSLPDGGANLRLS